MSSIEHYSLVAEMLICSLLNFCGKGYFASWELQYANLFIHRKYTYNISTYLILDASNDIPTYSILNTSID